MVIVIYGVYLIKKVIKFQQILKILILKKKREIIVFVKQNKSNKGICNNCKKDLCRFCLNEHKELKHDLITHSYDVKKEELNEKMENRKKNLDIIEFIVYHQIEGRRNIIYPHLTSVQLKISENL